MPLKKTPEGVGIVQPSDLTQTGQDMIGFKEEVEYKGIDGVSDVEGMTPSDAAGKKGSDCKC